jgi:hypothetical protein
MNPDNDLLDRDVHVAFDAAHHDPRWSGPVWTDPVARVRAGARARRRRAAAVASVLTVALLGAGAVAVQTLRPATDRLQASPGAGDDSSGLRWLLTPAQWDTYTAAHPSPSPMADHVASPAPADDGLRRLQSDVAAALPAGAHEVRADAADGGLAADAVVWFRLGDGTPVAVERRPLDYPLALELSTGGPVTERTPPEHFTDPLTWPSGTAYSVVTGQALGYGFGEGTEWSGPIVWTATPDGWFTSWTAPVDTDRLVGWAQAADANFTGD